MTPLLRASPSPGPCPPSPDRGSAPPPPSRSPALPVNMCATCPAASSCAHAERGLSTQAIAVHVRPATLDESAAASSLASPMGAGTQCRDTQAASVHVTGLQCSAIPCCCPVLSRLQQHSCIAAHMHCRHTCIAAHPGGRCHVAVDLYPYLQERGWDGYRPLNGCSQGLVVRGISPPEPCLYTCHTKVFSKVSNSPPIHQYFPAASPYGAQYCRCEWIGLRGE